MEKCVFCGLETDCRQHHIIPRSKNGKETVSACETCENFCHSMWSNKVLTTKYNTVESILETKEFKNFLKWRLKQPPTVLFRSNRGRYRDKHKYH